MDTRSNIKPTNKTYRKIKHSSKSILIRMGNHNIKQALPLNNLEQISPFILLHHFDLKIKKGGLPFNVSPHPHRGFCPITYMFEGSITHKDSLGNHQTIHSNEVQWINAARGIIHSEKAAHEILENDGRFQGIQLWINLPAKDKMKHPEYMAIKKENMTLIEKKGVEIRLVSGNLQGKKGKANSDNITAMIKMQGNSSYELEVSSQNHTALYILDGEIQINNKGGIYTETNLLWFENEEGKIKIECTNNAKLLFLSGKPINEPMVSYGPFVMNTQAEIKQAIEDYQNNEMGILV